MKQASEQGIIWFNRLVLLSYASMDRSLQEMDNLGMKIGDAIDVYSICFPDPIHSVFWEVVSGEIARIVPLQALN